MADSKLRSRRRFLKGTGAALASFTIAPSYILGGQQPAPSDRVDLAYIGTGGRGGANLRALKGHSNVVAFCDVDFARCGNAFKEFPDAQRFTDFRRMLDKIEGSIDAVAVSTPDHTHAVASMDVLRRGKHLYCEKPLAHSVHEVRALVNAAREADVVTQLGNQGHSYDSIRQLVEWVHDGAIGNVHTIHASCSANHSKIDELRQRSHKAEPPKSLNWDLWLGPSPQRAYHPMYCPGRWRGWKPFGNGTIGDWVCHVLDGSFWALDLGAPEAVTVLEVRDYDPVAHADTYPRGSLIQFDFPAKNDRGPVTVYWRSGDERMPRPRELEDGRDVPLTGAFLMGDKGVIMHGSHGSREVTLIPQARMDAYKQPTPSIPRVPGGHRVDFIEAIRKGRKSGSDFSYGGPLTEIALLGVIALNFPGRRLSWDSEAMRFTDCDEANAYVAPAYREGWTLS